MLKRGIDVKVAEMPLGKDPADIIQTDPTAFKKIVGKSVHVIEFLLHVLKEQYDDERTLKLKTREEILPFVLLLPNRIDQDHFVSVVAKAVGASKDAIRFEIDRLREETPRDSGVETEKPAEKPAPSSLFEKKYVYLSAVKEVVPELKPKIDAAMAVFAQYVKYPVIDSGDLARTTFELSESFDHRKEYDIHAEIVGEMNRFHQEAAKKLLARVRADNEDWTTNDEAIALHQKAEEMRREIPYSVEDLSNIENLSK
jgi:DNA primase